MTDEQIIIDGVNVSGCGSYMDNGECISELVYPDYCKACPNCTYKLEQKLKAKEQECKALREEKAYTDMACEQFEKQVDQLKAEVKSKTEYIQEQREIIDQYSKEIEMYKKCQGKRASKREEELKTELEKMEALKDTYFACYHAKHEDLAKKYELLKKCYKNNLTLLDYEEANTTKLVNKVMKLEKTLTEIKKIAENMNKECFYNDFDCKDCDMKNGCTYFNKKQIIQEISEVE